MSNTIVRSIKAEFVVAVARQFEISKSSFGSLVRDAVRVCNGDPITAAAPVALANMELEYRGLRMTELVADEPPMPEIVEPEHMVEFTIQPRPILEQARKDLQSLIAVSGLWRTVEIERESRRKNHSNSIFRTLMNKYIKEGGPDGLAAYIEAGLEIGLCFKQAGKSITRADQVDYLGSEVYHDYVGTLKAAQLP